MWNPKTIDTDQALYIAVADALERDVINGLLKPGEKMPTHRELAEMIGINITTATRAYREAERRGLVKGTVGRGTYIASDYGSEPSIMKLGQKTSSIIDLGPVYPSYDHEPELSKLLEKLNKTHGLNRYLKYSDPRGLSEHREAGAAWVSRFGVTASADDVLICAGAQHALNCCLTSVFEAGDRIAVDCLTYSGFKSLAKSLSIKLEPIEMDREGMLPEDLEAACHRGTIKGLYVMPSVQNPTNASMSMQRREKIADIAKRYGLLIIEDDIYSFINDNNLPPIAAILPHSTIYIASVSKAFFAGLRVSFVVAPKQLRLQLAKAVLNTIWMAPSLTAAIVCECIRDGSAETILHQKRMEAIRRFEIAQRVLSDYSFIGIPTGHYIWLTLPSRWSGSEFEARALKSGVNLFCAEKFIVGGSLPPAAVRISLSGPDTKEELEQGLSILADILQEEEIELKPIL